MKIADLAMQLFRIYSGGDVASDSGFLLLDFQLAAQQATAMVVSRKILQQRNLTGEWEINDSYLEVFEENEVLYNTKTDRYYLNLPVDVMNLPNNIGFFYIGQNQGLMNPFPMTTMASIGFYTNMPDDITAWFPTSKTIEFVNFDTAIKNIVLAVVPTEPKEVSGEDVSEVTAIVMKQFMPTLQIQEDKISDSNPNSK